MTTSYIHPFLEIQRKFGVQFVESIDDRGKVRVQAAKGRNAALESHAVRALLHLCRMIITSLFNFNQPRGAMGFTGPQDYPADPPENMPKLKGQSGDSVVKNKCMTGDDSNVNTCPICLDKMTDGTQLDCTHEFCRKCLLQAVNSMGPCCPVCKHVFGMMVGNQPDGTMTTNIIGTSLPGFTKCGTIVINYNIPSGRQTEKHQNPGMRYEGISRKAYLPNNKEGKEVLQLLRKAFDQKLIFTIGESRTTSANNQVTWNDIHHKTSIWGGPSNFGYPDPDYLKRVRAELKDKGIE
ncbi:E3 ubiquitin-protein ligase DTX3L [Takifugu flavidus]|uniref:E3 ubiquitin-protein ligase n=2 Tax=Takifugu flavidus TaxID=433684 RepID=A0A5C6N5K7_9TELE|nr:E3 ubiquitin-protein ligase DTX3L [Takifugu flavidus]